MEKMKDMGKQKDPIYGYMCKVDWDHEVPYPIDGNRIFWSIDTLKQHLSCVEECGIVKVKLSFVEVVQEGKE